MYIKYYYFIKAKIIQKDYKNKINNYLHQTNSKEYVIIDMGTYRWTEVKAENNILVKWMQKLEM